MKIAVSVVFYNPSKDNIEHALKLADYFDFVYLLDNSDKSLDLKAKNNVIYSPYKENKGIAFALEDGLQKAIKDNADILLTLDQDSTYPFDKHNEIVKRIEKLDLEKDAIFALTTDHDYKEDYSNKEELVKDAITSGNFLNVALFKKHDIHFPVELFIDYVDFEFDRRIIEKGLNIIQSHEYYICHKIGNPLHKNILGIKFDCMNHSPIRYYYRFRNAYYLKKQFPKYYKKLAHKTLVVEKLKMRLFEPNKKEKNKMIKLGIKDAKQSKLGSFQK